MIKKGNLWQADWFDAEGHRRRKGFTQERHAIAFQNKMRRLTDQTKRAPKIVPARKLIFEWRDLQRYNTAKLAAKAFAQAAGEATPAQITPQMANAVIAEWRRREFSEATVHSRRKYLIQLVRWLESHGAPAGSHECIARVPQPPPRDVIAAPGELPRLLQLAPKWQYCWLILTAAHGVRFAEAQRICPQSFNENTGTFSFRAKGGGTHTLPANDELIRLFEEAQPCDDPTRPLIQLFFDREWPAIAASRRPRPGKKLRNGKLSTDYIYKAWDRLKKLANVNPNLHPHDLRRTLAVKMFDLTNDLRDVKRMLGHKNLQTTAMYLEHHDSSKIRGILNKIGATQLAAEPVHHDEKTPGTPGRVN